MSIYGDPSDPPDLEDPIVKRGMHLGGGRGIGGSGQGPAGGFLAYAGGSPGFSSGGYEFGSEARGNSRAALLKRIMMALQAIQGGQGDVALGRLEPGEIVMNSPAAAMAGPELESLNAAGNEVRQNFLSGGRVLDAASLAGSATGQPWVPMALQAVKYVSDLLGGEPDGPNGLERVRAMGLDPGRTEMPAQRFQYGGYVRNPYAGQYGAGAATSTGSGTAQAGSGSSFRGMASRFINRKGPTSPTAAPQTSFLPGQGAGTPVGTNLPGQGGLPTSYYDELLRRASEGGAFDPNYGYDELVGSLNRNAQGAQEADVRDLMASGLDDPSLYASALLSSRSARSKETSRQLSDARLAQTKQYQDFINSLLGARHSDQIQEMLARIK